MENEILVQEHIPIISDDRIIQMAEAAEKRIDAIRKIKEISLKVTNVNDWVDQNGRPYLQASGSTKVARVFGVSWRIEEPTRQEFEDGHFQYTFKGEFSLAGSTIESLGVRSSRDGFFSTRYRWSDKERKKVATSISPNEIDEGDVKKAALTNLLGNGVTTILGIRNLTWDEISDTIGISREDVTNIQYKKPGSVASKPKTPLKEPKSTSEKSSKGSTIDAKKNSRIDYVTTCKEQNEDITKDALRAYEVLGKTVKEQEKLLNEMTDVQWLKLVNDIEKGLAKEES